MFCAPEPVFGGSEGAGFNFHILLPDSFSAVPKTPGPIFIFCAPGLISGGTESAGFNFHVLRSQTHFRRYRGHRVSFSCFALPDSFWEKSRAPGIVSCIALPDPFSVVQKAPAPVFIFSVPDPCSTVPRESGPVFIFYAPGPIFGRTEGADSSFSGFCAS
jgi:hypothetical protein